MCHTFSDTSNYRSTLSFFQQRNRSFHNHRNDEWPAFVIDYTYENLLILIDFFPTKKQCVTAISKKQTSFSDNSHVKQKRLPNKKNTLDNDTIKHSNLCNAPLFQQLYNFTYQTRKYVIAKKICIDNEWKHTHVPASVHWKNDLNENARRFPWTIKKRHPNISPLMRQ